MPNDIYVSLEQHVLPFFDIVTSDGGLQFGLPISYTSLNSMQRRLAERADTAVLVLYEDGRTNYRPFPFFVAGDTQTGQPPLPYWGWTPVNINGDTEYARVVAPTQSAGSMPLDQLGVRRLGPKRQSSAIFTPAGLHRYNLPPTPFDSPNDMVLASTFVDDDSTVATCNIHHTPLFDYEQYDGEITALFPLRWCFENKLWTTHLLRLAQITMTPL